MQYRSFPKIPELTISTLGFGCMRLPTVKGDSSQIDEEQASSLLRKAIGAGVNYIDTAWPYHGGQSERLVGRALRGGLRDKVLIATKSPVWLVEAERDWDRFLDEQLKKLETSRIDFYLLHALGARGWETVQRLHGLKALERAKADGRIGHIGFSFHASLDDFRKILDSYDWEFCQIQLNYVDERYQAGLEGMRLAAARKVGVIAMEPLRGGALAMVAPKIQSVLTKSGRTWSAAEWALRWIWHHPEIVTLLSGMNATSQLDENVAVASAAAPLSADELALVDEAKTIYWTKLRVPCTTCGYCLPCPNGVSIPDVFAAYNSASMFDSKVGPAEMYRRWVQGNGGGAEKCAECGACLPRCPQGIPIIEKLREAHESLTRP